MFRAVRSQQQSGLHGAPEYSVAEGNDYPAHEQTYRNFISLVKWVGGFVVLIVAGMAYFLT